MVKKIKGSKRGLTFSLSNNELNIGERYKYRVDKGSNQITIIPCEDGNLKVSKKKVGKNKEYPLIDLRSEKIREVVKNSEWMEIEILADRIVVNVFKKQQLRVLKKGVSKITEILGIRNKETIVIPKLQLASGMDASFVQLDIESYLENVAQTVDVSTSTKQTLKNDIHDVFKMVGLFSGSGMLEYSFSKDKDFEIVFANDYDASACESYRANIGPHIVHGDIRNIDKNTIPKADFVLGGISCKAHSASNRQNRLEDHPDYFLLEEYIETVKACEPEVFAIENVPSYVSANESERLEKLLQELPGYAITTQIVNDSDLGGYTNRERCIIIGSSDGFEINMPNIKVLPVKTVRDALSKVDATWFNYADISKAKPETLEKMKWVPQGGNWRDIPKSVFEYKECTHSNVMRRLAWDEVAPTIENVRKNNTLHPEENRILSVSEAASLMGLDKHFKFLGSLADRQQQVCNGVPQSVSIALKSVIKKALQERRSGLMSAI